jgi:hypothetical protein
MSKQGQCENDQKESSAEILDYFKSVNNSLIEKKLQNYLILQNNDLSQRISYRTVSIPATNAFIDITPIAKPKKLSKTKLRKM